MGTPDPETIKSPEPQNLKIVKLISIDKAVGCPQCGAVSGLASSGITICPFCTSKLLPQESAVAHSQAARSNLNHCQPSTEVLRSFPGLNIIANNNTNAFEMLGRVSQFNTESRIDELTDRHILPEQMPFVEQEVAETLMERHSLFASIISIPNENLSIAQGSDNYGTVCPNILLSVAHPDKTYTLLRASSRPYPPGSATAHDCVYVHLTKLNRTPDNENQLNSLVTNAIYKESSKNDIIVAESSLSYDTEDHQRSPIFKDDQAVHRYQEIITSAPLDKKLAEKYWTGIVKQLTPEQLKEFVIVQEVWFGRALREKIATVFTGSDTSPIIEPIIDSKKAAEFDAQYYIDSVGSTEATVETANHFACGSCGSVLEHYQQGEAFTACSSCHEVNDIVATGRISIETLEARKIEATVVPAEYLFSLISQTAAADAKVPDELDINFDTFVAAFSNESITTDEVAKSPEVFQLINGLLKVASEHPHLLTRVSKDDKSTEEGVCISIAMPDDSNMSVKTDSGYQIVDIPQSLRGNVVVFSFGDFDNARYSGSHGWCKVKAIVHTPAELSQITSIGQWNEAFDSFSSNRGSSQHWLNRFPIGGVSIDATTNFNKDGALQRSSGKYYEMVRDLLAKVPRGNELNTILSSN